MADPNALRQYIQGLAPVPMQQTFQRNAPYLAPGVAPESQFNTQLPPLKEMMFQQWVKQNNVPFDSSAKVTDYDMRGFFDALQSRHPRAVTAMNANDGQMHYPDYWKTPYHETFSNESQWANSDAPRWNEQDQLVGSNGRIVFDEKAKKR